MSSGSINFNGTQLWYEKFGTGAHPVLLIPGAIGTGRTDYASQLQGPHALNLKKYTLIAVEPLGWGRSRPPPRKYDSEIYHTDARSFYQLMEELGHVNFSIIGWSDGAKTALIMASVYPSRITSCIVWGVVAYATQKDIMAVNATKNLKFWDKEVIANYERVYGPEWYELWVKHVAFIDQILTFYPDGFVKKEMKKIRCPVFIMHGDQDTMVDVSHPIYVSKNISDARLKRFPNAAHNLQYTYPAEFKKLAENFLDDAEQGF